MLRIPRNAVTAATRTVRARFRFSSDSAGAMPPAAASTEDGGWTRVQLTGGTCLLAGALRTNAAPDVLPWLAAQASLGQTLNGRKRFYKHVSVRHVPAATPYAAPVGVAAVRRRRTGACFMTSSCTRAGL